MKKNGKILVMDDEELIRTIIGRMLNELGYDTELAADGEEAIAFFLKAISDNRPFAAVLLDLTVRGGMGGKDCIARMREIDPGVRAIASSGYSDDPIMANYKDYGFAAIVTKPYRIEDLGEVLQEVLEHGAMNPGKDSPSSQAD